MRKILAITAGSLALLAALAGSALATTGPQDNDVVDTDISTTDVGNITKSFNHSDVGGVLNSVGVDSAIAD